jgi:hypothetical protein
MNKDQFFTQIDSEELSVIIDNATESVILAVPGIQCEVAEPLIAAASRLGKEMVIVCLDVNEQAMRLGYGDIKAVESLQENNMVIQHIDHLRFALIIADGQGYSFTPTALYLESEATSTLGFNAIKLTTEQIKEATVRLSPAAKAIAIATCNNEAQRNALEQVQPCMPNNPIDDDSINQISESLKQTPPVEFDVSRQVRVYSSYLQYVEVHMTGAAIQRQKVTMPKVLQPLGKDQKKMEGRLKTTFDLLGKDNKLSSKSLEIQLKELRDSFTPSLGRKHGRVMLKSNRVFFDKLIEEFKKQLEQHAKVVEESLQISIEESLEEIALYYLPLVKSKPPVQMLGQIGVHNTDDETILNWVKSELIAVFPSAEKMISKMELSVVYKDVTFENLNEDTFLDSVRKAFPSVNWNKAHSEYLAASES